jgi:hypothetical protein
MGRFWPWPCKLGGAHFGPWRGLIFPLAWADFGLGVHILALAWADFGLGVQRWPRKKKKKSCSEFAQILHGSLLPHYKHFWKKSFENSQK